MSIKARSSEQTRKDEAPERNLQLPAGSHSVLAWPHLQPSVEVPVQPLHNEQHGNAGATTVVVVDDRAMEIYQSLMLWQRPGRKERGLGYNAQHATHGKEPP